MTTSPSLSSLVDIHAFYSRYSQIVGKPTNSSRDGKEWHGSCPKCGGNDRFAFWESGRFSCSIRSSGCGISGSSPYWYLRDIEGLTHRNACEDLGIDLDQFEEWQEHKRALPLFMTSDQEPCKKWMDSASAFVYRSERYLWSDKGERALNYLQQGRGLSADTIRNARLGFCPGWYSESLTSWGLSINETLEETEIKIPEGIVIPWIVENKIWKLSVRRPSKEYFQVLGSSDALYNTDSMQPGMTVMLVESEIDALSVHQESGGIIAAVATGGTSKGQSLRWINALKQAPGILIGFDADEAGENGSATWKKKLPNALRWMTWAHDANQMLQDNINIRTWVEMGLRTLQMQIEEPVEMPPLEMPPLSIEKVVMQVRDMGFGEPLALLPESPKKPTPIKRKIDPWIKLNDKGLPEFCSTATCRTRAIAWKSNSEMMQAFCEKHKPARFGW